MCNLILTTLSSFVLIAYILACLFATQRIPTSVSATYYMLERKWLFSAVMLVSAGFVLIPWLNVASENCQCLAFLSVAAMMFVGCTPAFRDDFVGKIHTGAAAVLFICSTMWIFIDVGWQYGIGLLAIILIATFSDRKRAMWWLEIALICFLYPTLISRIIP